MNTTAIISAEIQVSDIPIFEALFKRLKAKKIVVESKKDDTEMTVRNISGQNRREKRQIQAEKGRFFVVVVVVVKIWF